MAGTRKLEKFDVDGASSMQRGTRRLERFDLPMPPSARISIATPIEAIPPATLEAAKPTLPPPLEWPAEEMPVLAARVVADIDAPPASEPRFSHAPRAVDREPDIEALRTRLARKFSTLADEVTAACAELQIGAGAWQPELTAPEGMSTASGTQEHIQHLRLRPKRRGHHVLVGGLVNLATKRAELRTYAAMTEAHEARFGEQPIGFTAPEWEQFLRRAEVVLRAIGITSERVSPGLDPTLRRRRKPLLSRTTIAAAALGFITPAAFIVLWLVWHRLAR